MLFKNYITQIHDWDCSPVALINALVWLAGKPATNLNIREQAAFACNTDEEGTHDEDFIKALEDSIEVNELNVSIKRFESDDWFLTHSEDKAHEFFTGYIKTELTSDNRAVILGHREVWDKDGEWHHTVFFKTFKVLFWRFYVGANMKAGKRYSIVSEKMFDRILTEADEDGPVTAWVLDKSED